MPIGKISQTSGKGADYSAGSQNIQHTTEQSKSHFITFTQIVSLSSRVHTTSYIGLSFLICVGGGKAQSGYQKSSSAHAYGAGAMNIQATTDVPKVKENLSYAKAEGAGTSQYGAGALQVETATNAPKIKHEGLGQVDKTKEQVHAPSTE